MAFKVGNQMAKGNQYAKANKGRVYGFRLCPYCNTMVKSNRWLYHLKGRCLTKR